jgi:hypothetical protein
MVVVVLFATLIEESWCKYFMVDIRIKTDKYSSLPNENVLNVLFY